MAVTAQPKWLLTVAGIVAAVAAALVHIHLASADLLRQFADVSQVKYAAGTISQQDVLKSVVELSKLPALSEALMWNRVWPAVSKE